MAQPTKNPDAPKMSYEEMEQRLVALAAQVEAMKSPATAATCLELAPFEKDPNRHYLPVESNNEANTIDMMRVYLDMPSPTEPGKKMYRKDGADSSSMLAADSRVRWLSCSLADYDAMVRVHAQEAVHNVMKPVTPDWQRGAKLQETEGIERTDFADMGSGTLSTHLVR